MKPLEEGKIISRFLPPIPKGIAVQWIKSQSLTGRFVLDPFGAAPDLSLEAASTGSRVIVTANNPITRLLTEIAANPPTATELRTILSTLSALRVRDERLETHITDLYQTTCPNCEINIEVEAFLWERESTAPYARLIHCKHCETIGEFPTTEMDKQRSRKFSAGGLHRSRAMERVAPLNDPDRIHVEEALNVYPPRAIYALVTIVNKLDMMDLSPDENQYLAALLLSAFDQANTLWPHPIARERPRQLTIPPTYRENNIWQAIENTAKELERSSDAVPITYWPVLPPEEGGICIFEGRIRNLAEQLTNIEIGAILTAIPRPNQAFWSLSALWSGWLWGHEAVEDFKSVLRRRRYDWAWHTTAIQTALESLIPALADDLPFLGIIGEAEPGFVDAVSIAATQAGFQLDHIDLFTDDELAQFYWKVYPQDQPPNKNTKNLSVTIIDTAHQYLNERGEPSDYLQLNTAIMEALARQNLFPLDSSPADSYTLTQQDINAALNFQHGFLRFHGSEKSLNVGQWWLVEDNEAKMPLADRAEMMIVQYLVQHPGCSTAEVEADIRGQFPGVSLPSSKLICECLESYGENNGVGWQLREEDAPSKRREELSLMVDTISELGEKLGFTIESQITEDHHCKWINQHDSLKYIFYFSASALLGKFLIDKNTSLTPKIIVIPGGRANLVMYKLKCDPRLQKIFEQGWQFLKYRQARQLANSTTLIAEDLESHLGLDPLTYSETQMRMF